VGEEWVTAEALTRRRSEALTRQSQRATRPRGIRNEDGERFNQSKSREIQGNPTKSGL